MDQGYQRLSHSNHDDSSDLRVPMRTESLREEHRRVKEKAKDSYDCCKNFAFIFIGVLTALYTLAELVFGVYGHVLVLLSDGFHNLSDVVALAIGLWASRKSRAAKSMQYSYGFARTELLGALVNGCFLLSLGFYVLLEAIPKFIRPDPPDETVQLYFIIGAAVGLGLNVLGAIVFFVTGKGHSHAGHSHGHDEPSAHVDEPIKKKKKKKADKKEKHDHEHGHEHKHGDKGKGEHEHEHGHGEDKCSDDEQEHEHSHGHGHEHEDHAHSHGEAKKKDKKKYDHAHDHAHEHKEGHEHEHEHDHKKKKEKGHGHEHGHDGAEHQPHEHDHGSAAGEAHADHNLHAIFLHFLGDALSSVFVLATALLWHFFPLTGHPENWWIVYIDPASSVIVVGIILFSTIPLVRSVLAILLQRVPKGIDSDLISAQLRMIQGVVSVHDLHIWELVSGLNLASVHLDIMGTGGESFNKVLKKVRRVFHRNKIHSVTVQPEFVSADHPGRAHCETMCVSECVETWCCEPEPSNELTDMMM